MGRITDIQRFSLNDGPGIRTTVFFKGCNARCIWCHNPETLSYGPTVLRYPDKCMKCGMCVGNAGADVLPPERPGPEMASRCVTGALVTAGREMTAEEILREVIQDIDYYRESGGGVTLSGGEVMMQPKFACELLALCRENGISTAIETNLMYDYSLLEKAMPHLDLIMADIKLLDAEKHLRSVGLPNHVVLENVKRLAARGKDMILRTPVIPGINDNEAEIGAIAAFIAENAPNVLYYELLNFNPLGGGKYTAAGIENRFAGVKPLEQEKIGALAECARSAGIPVRVG